MPNNKPVGVAYEDPQLDGAIMGKSGGTAAFFGATPTSQPASLTTQTIPALTTTQLGGLTTTQIAAIETTLLNVNEVITDLKTLGIISSS